MKLPHDDIDPEGLLEYSVVFTDRSLNHMSARFTGVMQEIIEILRSTYQADHVAVVPGGGTFAMEAVARSLAVGRQCLVLRNGLFSYRWSQILDSGGFASQISVCTAEPTSAEAQAPWRPAPIAEVVEQIRTQQPDVVFAPHVETASGILLPDDYISAVAQATHDVGGLFVLDCIASGAVWVNMQDLGVDVLISAPQKGWSGSPGAGYVMLTAAAAEAVCASESSSFSLDVAKWLFIAEEYREGRTPYHSTMPTDTLQHNVGLMRATRDTGLEKLRAAQFELGDRVRVLLAERGFSSVAAEGFGAPGVVVVHSEDPQIRTGARFKEAGLQVAAGVPLHCGEPESFSSFRVGLFGLDKLSDVDGAVARLEKGLDSLGL